MTRLADLIRRYDLFEGGPGLWLWRVILVWFAAWSLVGLFVVGFSLDIPGGSIPDMLFMILGSALVFMEMVKLRGIRQTSVAFVWVACVSGIIEGVGAETGVPFGSYYYTEAFGWRILGILPISIPLAWWIVVMPLFLLAACRLKQAGAAAWLFISMSVASSAVWIDLLLEPVAWQIRGYWIWEEGGPYFGVPSQNFLGWFMTAFLISLGLTWIFRKSDSEQEIEQPWGPWTQRVLAVVIFTFVLSAMVGGYAVAGVIGLCFLGFQAWSIRPLKAQAFAEKERSGTNI